MSSTLVVQSHTDPLPFSWLSQCLDSVKSWSIANGYDYQFLGDELFHLIDSDLVQKTIHQKVIATDLARLYVLKKNLDTYDRVIWLDADFLIFAPQSFLLPNPKDLPEGYMLGREVWIQEDASKKPVERSIRGKASVKLKANIKVHNAFLLFDRGNTFLDFYLEHAERLLFQCEGRMPPQFIGPKLLTALHNVVQCPVLESAGMFSPLVIKDLLSDGKPTCALNLLKKRSSEPVAAVNLCSSLHAGRQIESQAEMTQLISKLVSQSRCI